LNEQRRQRSPEERACKIFFKDYISAFRRQGRHDFRTGVVAANRLPINTPTIQADLSLRALLGHKVGVHDEYTLPPRLLHDRGKPANGAPSTFAHAGGIGGNLVKNRPIQPDHAALDIDEQQANVLP
jgi:hypothetical protein